MSSVYLEPDLRRLARGSQADILIDSHARWRHAPDDAVIAAEGSSCRHQIADGAGWPARHVASILATALQIANEVRHGA